MRSVQSLIKGTKFGFDNSTFTTHRVDYFYHRAWIETSTGTLICVPESALVDEPFARQPQPAY